MHPTNPNKLDQIANRSRAIATDLPIMHTQGTAVDATRRILVQLASAYEENSHDIHSSHQKLIASYHRIAVSLYRLYKTIQNESQLPSNNPSSGLA